MTWRRIAVYYTLSIILGGYYFLFEWRPTTEKPIPNARPVQQSRFLPIARNDIHEIALRNSNANIRFRRNEDTWEVVEPSNAKVTSALVTSLVENLTVEKEVQTVEQSASDFAPYGLAQPFVTLMIKGAADKLLATVFLGDRNPTQSAVYARKEDSKQVVLLGYSVRYYAELIFEAAGFTQK
jgi:hypothetical protein